MPNALLVPLAIGLSIVGTAAAAAQSQAAGKLRRPHRCRRRSQDVFGMPRDRSRRRFVLVGGLQGFRRAIGTITRDKAPTVFSAVADVSTGDGA